MPTFDRNKFSQESALVRCVALISFKNTCRIYTSSDWQCHCVYVDFQLTCYVTVNLKATAKNPQRTVDGNSAGQMYRFERTELVGNFVASPLLPVRCIKNHLPFDVFSYRFSTVPFASKRNFTYGTIGCGKFPDNRGIIESFRRG